ncbi:hypothetical protein Sango_1253400 [Sesamum angolense]|uniref:Integrase catalytic domain-containing protein n=1 Tax=Sesamum angolense TaxID=2727404 RepID=A0AAE1WQQ0_9LAMI|nr:hypothetical protein Sango_1253400 [Sesamum angolense]
MKKDVPFQWDEACDKAFKSIKSYLMKPPVLVAPVPGRPLILYVATQECSVGILLAKKNDEGNENALYYLILSDRFARWYLQLQQFEITYVPQKAVKGQVLADFLTDHPMLAKWELSDDLPNEDVLIIEVTPPWRMYFDGASHKEGVGAGVVFVTSEGELVVNQLLGLYEVKKPELFPYHNYAKRLMGWLIDVELEHLPRKDNKQADALAKLASTLSMTDKETRIPIYVVGPLTKSSGGHLYILAATDYFSKWAEAVPLKKVKKENVVDFIRTHIIYRYGVPRCIITDNEKPFCNSLMDKLCQKFDFEQRNSSMYYAAANGLVEAFNKTLCNLLKKVVAKSKRDWHERIGEALWAYKTTVGDSVLAVRRPIITTHQTGNKFLSKWDGPYIVKEAYTNGAYKLIAEDGLRIGPIDGKFLKRYYA